ncbi:MAG: flavin prenyltransferase UbiX [Mariprofundaceae bacterium]|nr:flavin prenyltransferase UbiX [Mariprofundaceae bacterium]
MRTGGGQVKQVVVAMTGASGAAYGLRLIQRLAAAGVRQHLLFSDAARVVLKQEAGLSLPGKTEEVAAAVASYLHISDALLHHYHQTDWFSPAASGSAGIRHMVVIPCSMGSLARIAGGVSDNLLERAADVMLKERGRLILVPRETPLSSIHLEHMLKLSRMGVDMIPAMPGFYHRPESVDELVNFVVDRVMDHLNIDDGEARRWGG